MTTYRAPLGDMRFVLDELLDTPALFARLGFDMATPDVVDCDLPTLHGGFRAAAQATAADG